MTAMVGAQVSAVVLSGIQLDHSTHPHLGWDSRLEVPVLVRTRMRAEHGQEGHMKHDQEHMDSERKWVHLNTPAPWGQNCTSMNHKNASSCVWVPLVPMHKGCTSVLAGERHWEDKMISLFPSVAASQGWGAGQWV